jgi:hypothetical protein
MIYNLYVFNRSGTCLFQREWNKQRSAHDDRRLVFGLLFSLKHFSRSLLPTGCVITAAAAAAAAAVIALSTAARRHTEGVYRIKTKAFTLHHFETATGLHFVVNSDPATDDLRPHLQHIYASIYVPTVVRNPLYKMNTPIECARFAASLDAYVSTIPNFAS